MDGLLITHEGKRYFVLPNSSNCARFPKPNCREAEKRKPLPTDPVVAVPTHGKELSLGQLAGVVGGTRQNTLVCPVIF